MKALKITFVLALALLVPGTANAVTVTEYDVTIEGRATYSRADVWPVQHLGQAEQYTDATFKWKTRVPSVTFVGKEVGAISDAVTPLFSDVDARLQASLPTSDGGTQTGVCTGDIGGAVSPGSLGAGVIPAPVPEVESLDVRVLGGAFFQLPTCSGLFAPGPGAFAIDGSGAEIPFGPFDEPFQMPHEAIGMGKVIQLLESSVSGSRCPGYFDGTVSCALNWKATVTFVRTAQREVEPEGSDDELDESDIPTPPQPAPELDESDIPDPPSPLDGLVIPMPRKRAKLAAGAKQAKLSLTCPVACSGTATAYAARSGAGAAAGRPLARVRFKGAARRATTVVLRFGPSARRAIRRAGAVRVQLRVSPQAGGKSVRRTVVLRLPRDQVRRGS